MFSNFCEFLKNDNYYFASLSGSFVNALHYILKIETYNSLKWND